MIHPVKSLKNALSATVVKIYDASNPGTLPAGFDVVAGYIGGNTPHVWTPDQWASFGKRKKLPIWVYTGRGGLNDAQEAARQLYELKVPKGIPVVYDMETIVDPVNVQHFAGFMAWIGYRTWPYGSASTIFKNPACSGYWVADYVDYPFMYPGRQVRATQYQNGVSYDRSLLKPWQYYNVLKAW